MPKHLTPISNKNWVLRRARYANAYGKVQGYRLRLYYLPITNIVPESFELRIYDLELMLVCLRNGAWLNGEDWHPYVKYTIAKRLKVRADLLFHDDYAQYRDIVLDYQMNGGRNSVRDELRKLSRTLQQSPMSSHYDKVFGKLLGSITHPIEENTYIQPFHWIRVCLAAAENNAVWGMNRYTAENQAQKATLCEMLRGTIG